jgi:hypothetical protein
MEVFKSADHNGAGPVIYNRWEDARLVLKLFLRNALNLSSARSQIGAWGGSPRKWLRRGDFFRTPALASCF